MIEILKLLQQFKVINYTAFPILFFNVVLDCTYKIKLELMHIILIRKCKSLQQITYNNKSYTIYINNKKYIYIYIYIYVYYCNKININIYLYNYNNIYIYIYIYILL